MTDMRARWWAPVYLYAALIFVVSSIPRVLPPQIRIPFLDKGLHMIEYGLLGFLLTRALFHDSPSGLRQNFRFWAVLFALLYGVSDEWHQSFVPMREASVWDALFDGVGAAIGQLFFSHGKDVTIPWDTRKRPISAKS